MKFIHLSDLHLGKRVHDVSMIEDQRDILTKILAIIDEEAPDCVILAGDIYDKAVPTAEATALFDDFLVRLAQRRLQVFAISGNHDSPERIAFGSRLMDASGIHLSPVYDGSIRPVTLTDDFGPVHIYMLPFVKPMHVRRFFQEEPINTYTDAIGVAIGQMQPDFQQRNVLITHQFVTGASRSESEEITVGGVDNVDATVFQGFDYVALGHIHSPQNCGSPAIRYCGTPLKYSFSEARDEKSVTVAELGEKGTLTVRTVPLTPKHEMVELKGTFRELTDNTFYAGTSWQSDYVHVTLTDEEDIVDAVGKLRQVYHNLLRLDYDNSRTQAHPELAGADIRENISPMELFAQFYTLQNGRPMSREQLVFLEELLEKAKEAQP